MSETLIAVLKMVVEIFYDDLRWTDYDLILHHSVFFGAAFLVLGWVNIGLGVDCGKFAPVVIYGAAIHWPMLVGCVKRVLAPPSDVQSALLESVAQSHGEHTFIVTNHRLIRIGSSESVGSEASTCDSTAPNSPAGGATLNGGGGAFPDGPAAAGMLVERKESAGSHEDHQRGRGSGSEASTSSSSTGRVVRGPPRAEAAAVEHEQRKVDGGDDQEDHLLDIAGGRGPPSSSSDNSTTPTSIPLSASDAAIFLESMIPPAKDPLVKKTTSMKSPTSPKFTSHPLPDTAPEDDPVQRFLDTKLAKFFPNLPLQRLHHYSARLHVCVWFPTILARSSLLLNFAFFSAEVGAHWGTWGISVLCAVSLAALDVFWSKRLLRGMLGRGGGTGLQGVAGNYVVETETARYRPLLANNKAKGRLELEKKTV